MLVAMDGRLRAVEIPFERSWGKVGLQQRRRIVAGENEK
jgi:hypothetical protein